MASGETNGELTAGTRLADRFEIRAPVSSGAMGAVYRAFDHEQGVEVAIKRLLMNSPATARSRNPPAGPPVTSPKSYTPSGHSPTAASVAGASVGASVAGISVAGISVAGASVATSVGA